MTFDRFTDLFCQMIYEVSGNRVGPNSRVGDGCDNLDIVEAECRFEREYRTYLNTDQVHYTGRLSNVLSKIYNNNPELVNINI